MPTMSTVVLLYLLGYLPATPLPPGIAPPVPHLQCETLPESEYLPSDEGILDQITDRGRSIAPTVSYAPSLEGPSWWMNPAPTESDAASFFDFAATR